MPMAVRAEMLSAVAQLVQLMVAVVAAGPDRLAAKMAMLEQPAVLLL